MGISIYQMKKKFARVYQFKITLKGIAPPVWRRIHVPETYSFWDLHVAAQNAMGWQDCHLHDFAVRNPNTRAKERMGIPDEDGELDILPGWKFDMADYFSKKNITAAYIYDYGDNWEHAVKLEKILPRDKQIKYPHCVDGERACPPEDCGSIHGYEQFLEAIMDPGHEQHEDMLRWAGEDFEPERFDPNRVTFDDPRKQWNRLWE
jgi:hypothetical protein